jgi:uncharacterized protein with NRDE domain
MMVSLWTMCLISIAHNASKFPLVLAANRDELYARPTRPAHVWEDDPRVIGGRDLRAGGSWLAVRKGGGRLAAVTNVRGMGREEGGPSRGLLVSQFVRGDDSPMAYAQSIRGEEYAGFHLIVGDGEIVHRSNATPVASIEGLFAISNAPPGAHWPKVDLAREFLAGAIERNNTADDLANDLLRFLSTPRGAPIDREVFVTSSAYGTRSSTVIILEASGAGLFVEQNYSAGGKRDGAALRFYL